MTHSRLLGVHENGKELDNRYVLFNFSDNGLLLSVLTYAIYLVANGMQTLKEYIDIDSTTLRTLFCHFCNHQ